MVPSKLIAIRGRAGLGVAYIVSATNRLGLTALVGRTLLDHRVMALFFDTYNASSDRSDVKSDGAVDSLNIRRCVVNTRRHGRLRNACRKQSGERDDSGGGNERTNIHGVALMLKLTPGKRRAKRMVPAPAARRAPGPLQDVSASRDRRGAGNRITDRSKASRPSPNRVGPLDGSAKPPSRAPSKSATGGAAGSAAVASRSTPGVEMSLRSPSPSIHSVQSPWSLAIRRRCNTVAPYGACAVKQNSANGLAPSESR